MTFTPLVRKCRQYGIRLLCAMWLGLAACEFPGQTAVSPTPSSPPSTTLQTTTSPTATIPLPTPAPTEPPPPTPTYNPGVAEWTVLIYLDADNNLDSAAVLDLNEMEAAGGHEDVNVLVQIDRSPQADWTGARRYRILPDSDPTAVNSELVAELGEVNMGEPGALADFVAWGLATYPANRTALVIWDHGAGWNGIAFDDTIAFADQRDHISLPDLDTALGQALAQTGREQLDVIAFDACLMGQLDVLQTVQPYARYAVGSEELTPGKGWNYEQVLAGLYADTAVSPADFARHLAADFVDFYTRTEPDDFVTMAAVDLARLLALNRAVATLAETLAAHPVLLGSAVGDSRSGAESFARAYAGDAARYAAVDLRHFAAILAQRSPDERVRRAAETVVGLVDEAVIANERGRGFKHSGGVAVYFPRNGAFYAPDYGRIGRLPAWNDFLNSYHEVALADLPAPQVNIVNVLRDEVGGQAPAYLDFEVVGRDIENVVLVAGRYEENGRRRLLEYDNLIPEPTHLPDGSSIIEWRDGIHEDFFVWYTDVTYLYDAAGVGDFVVMWPTGPDSSLFSVQGTYRRSGTGAPIAANLVFDQETDKLVRVWGAGEGDAAAEITPQPGDTFRFDQLFLDTDGSVLAEPGPTLTFDEGGMLYFEWRPLPDGDYFLGFVAENVAGETADSFTDLTLSNSSAHPGVDAYLDPYLGFQFHYPENWYTPTYSGTLLYTANLSNTVQAQWVLYPDLEPGIDAQALKQQTLARFGPVDILFAEDVVVGGASAKRTAYGYTRAGGAARTGVFLTFVQDGVGYVVDVDGPQAQEAQTLATVDTLQNSWQFLQTGFGLQPGDWATIDLNNFTVARPSDFTYAEFRGWQRFSADRDTFVALRTEPATLETADVISALVRDAGQGVADFRSETPYRFSLGGATWLRADFSYTNDRGTEIWGFLMAKVENGQEVVAWAEAPRSAYNQLEDGVFLVMVADLTLR